MQAVLAAGPDDDDPYLVYADWCEEEGDLDRASFIRTQTELLRLPKWDVRRIELEVRKETLARAHRDEWLADAPQIEGIQWTGCTRSFPDVASAQSFEALCAARDSIVAHSPLTCVRVPWPQDQQAAKNAAPIPTLTQMQIWEPGVPEGPAFLGDSRLLSALTQLEVVDEYTPNAPVRRLFESPYLRKLSCLHLGRHAIGADAVPALISADLPGLRELNLRECGDDTVDWMYWDHTLGLGAAMEQLASWRGLEKLHTLNVGENRMYVEELWNLFVSPHVAGIESLDVSGTWAEPHDMLWDRLACTLHHVGLSFQPLEGKLQEGFESAALAGLRYLTAYHSIADERCAIAIANTSTLEHIDLREAYVQRINEDETRADVAIEPFLVKGDLPNLHTLLIGRRQHALENGADLVRWADTENMQRLQLMGSDLVDVAKALSEASFPNLKRLELHSQNDRAYAIVLESEIGKRLKETGGLRFAYKWPE